MEDGNSDDDDFVSTEQASQLDEDDSYENVDLDHDTDEPIVPVKPALKWVEDMQVPPPRV